MFASGVAEYARWYTKVDSDNPMLFPETKTIQERAYGLASWHANKRLTPSVSQKNDAEPSG